MTARIASSQVRSTVPTQAKTPAKAATTAAPAKQTAAAGWGAGAGKTTSLKISKATIGDGPKTTDGLQVPKGYKSEIKPLAQKLTDTVHGKAVDLEQNDVQATLITPGGKRFQLGSTDGMKQTASDWKEEVAASKKDPANEYMSLSWYSDHSMRGAGTAGKMMSVSEGGSDFTGGAHPNNGSMLVTYDASTGKQVKLDALLTQQQMSALVKDIETKLPRLKGPEGMEGSSWQYGDTAALRETVNSNFALTTDKAGKVQIQVAWESGIHALGGQMAHFTVEAPNDAAFRAKLGLE